MWNSIKNNVDILKLMEEFGYFHDACLKEMKYTSGAYVDDNLSMNPVNSVRELRAVFQRQYGNPCAIEIIFSEIYICHLNPVDDIYTCEIYGVTIAMENSVIYFGDSEGIIDFDSYTGTWVSAKRVKWRIADEYIGNKEVYISK